MTFVRIFQVLLEHGVTVPDLIQDKIILVSAQEGCEGIRNALMQHGARFMYLYL